MEKNDQKRLALLFIPFVMLNMLPYAIRTITFCKTDRLLTDSASTLSTITGIILAVFAGYFVARAYDVKSIKDYVTRILFVALAIGFYRIFAVYLSIILGNVLAKLPAVFWVLYVLLGFLLPAAMLALSILNGFASVKAFGVISGLTLAGLVAYELFSWAVTQTLSWASASFATMMLAYLLLAICETLTVFFLLKFALKFKKETEPSGKICKPILIAGIVGLSLVVGTDYYFKNSIKPWDVITNDIDESVANGSLSLVRGDIELALSFYEQANYKYLAWEKVLGAKVNTSLNKVNDINVKALLWQYDEDYSKYEEYLIFEDFEPELAKQYLVLTENAKKETDRAKAIKKDIKAYLIGTDNYTRESVMLSDIEDFEDEVLELLEKYSTLEAYINATREVSKLGRKGEYTGEFVNKLLDVAEANPDEIGIQYLAFSFATSYRTDFGDYGKMLGIGKRLVDLYEDNFNDKNGADGIRKMVARYCVQIHEYETAIELLNANSKANNTKEELLQLAACYIGVKDFENSIKTANEVLDKEPGEYTALYYLAMATLKNGDIITSLDACGKLFDSLTDESIDDKEYYNKLVYSLVNYYVLEDTQDYKFDIGYRKNDELLEKVSENKLMLDYFDAVYYCFERKDLDKAFEAAKKVESKIGETSCIEYLLGSIYFAYKEYDNSLICFQKSIQKDPDNATTWYALANAYDGLEMYEEALNTARKAQGMLPSTDHNIDWYGVATHVRNFISSMENKLESK